MVNMEERLKDYEEKLERAMRNHAIIEAEYKEVKRRYQNSKFNIRQLENCIDNLSGWIGVKKASVKIGIRMSDPAAVKIGVPKKDLNSRGSNHKQSVTLQGGDVDQVEL